MKKIMIVDDEPDIRSVVKETLEGEGYEIVIANNGDDCLEKYTDDIDLILMDIMMPGTPVKEIVKKLPSTKIAFLSVVQTTDAQKEDLLSNKNIVDFINKPFEVDELIKKVKKLVS